ncbi:MAG: glucokinase, partial [Gammaproteobacteria bacterium]|nr:glucokinase [Gammaproteobacteria bacterium]
QILAADIGGTNTRLIYADMGEGQRHVIAETVYPSAKYNQFADVLSEFLADHKIIHLDAACFSVAGPVKSGVVSVTNLPWVISEKQLADQLKIPRVKLINDFVAVAYGVNELDESDFIILQQGVNQLESDAVIIGAGTGLGAVHLVRDAKKLQAYSSETGHTGFAPQTEQQTRLLEWLQKQHAYVSLETLLSGNGLHRIYQFLHEVEGFTESAEVSQQILTTDPAQVITEHALAGDDVLCEKTLDCFIDIYGSAAGDSALHYFPVGEIYIAGGIAPKIKDKITGRRFIDALCNKGPMTENLKQLTVKLVMQEKAGLYGALVCGL